MSRQERLLRSRAAWLLESAGILHGNLSSRLVRCGKKGCRCARGERHQAFVLVLRREGKTVQVPIPRKLEPLVRRWLSQERELSGLLADLSRLHEERIQILKRRKEG
jgi:hypothetical protein